MLPLCRFSNLVLICINFNMLLMKNQGICHLLLINNTPLQVTGNYLLTIQQTPSWALGPEQAIAPGGLRENQMRIQASFINKLRLSSARPSQIQGFSCSMSLWSYLCKVPGHEEWNEN